MGWLFKSPEEKIAKCDNSLTELMRERKKLIADRDQHKRDALQASNEFNKIAQLESNIAGMNEQLAKSPRNADILYQLRKETDELQKLTLTALYFDRGYLNMHYDDKLLGLDNKIVYLQKQMKQLEDKIAQQQQKAIEKDTQKQQLAFKPV